MIDRIAIKQTNKSIYVEYYEDGKQKRKAFNFCKDPIRREQLINQFISQLQTGNAGTGNINPLRKDEYIVIFNHYLAKNKNLWRIKTFQTYQSKVKIYEDFLVQKRLSSSILTSKMFMDFLIWEKRSNAYINTFFDLFRQICEQEKITNIFDVKKLKEYKVPFQTFDSQAKKTLINELENKDKQLYIAALLMYYCFIRPQEFRFLKVGDIDFEQKTITIHSTISKNKKTQIVKIPMAFLPILKTYIGNGAKENFIFCSKGESTGPYNYKREALNKRHKKHLDELGIKGSFYCWKPTGMVDAYLSGVSILDLQLQARHHSLDQVKVYLSAYTLIHNTSFDNFSI